MSRIGIVMAVLCTAACCVSEPAWAQRPGEAAPLPSGQGTNPDVRSKQADPAAVEIPLYAGARVMDVLQALTDKGFLIKWNPKQIVPEMKLAERPRATRIDKLLAEILEPFGYRADRNQFDGGFRVRPMSSPKKGEVDIGDPAPPAKNWGSRLTYKSTFPDTNHSCLQTRMIRNKVRPDVAATPKCCAHRLAKKASHS